VSIEFTYIPPESTDETQPYLVDPNEGVFISDFSEGYERVLAIICDKDDSRGEVVILDVEDLPEIETMDAVYIEELPPHIGRILIKEGYHPHEQEFAAELGDTGTLRVTYVPSDKITRHANIPRGLIYPN
jgi:hypothetical protein